MAAIAKTAGAKNEPPTHHRHILQSKTGRPVAGCALFVSHFVSRYGTLSPSTGRTNSRAAGRRQVKTSDIHSVSESLMISCENSMSRNILGDIEIILTGLARTIGGPLLEVSEAIQKRVRFAHSCIIGAVVMDTGRALCAFGAPRSQTAATQSSRSEPLSEQCPTVSAVGLWAADVHIGPIDDIHRAGTDS